MNLKARASKLFGRRKPLKENTVAHTRVEEAVFADVSRRSKAVADALMALPALPADNDDATDVVDGKVWQKMAEDVFYEYFGQEEPVIHYRSTVDPRFHVNRALADKQSRLEDFTDTHAMTRGNVMESTLATLGALGSIRAAYGDELADHADTANKIADAQDHLASLDDQLEALRQKRQNAPGGQRTIDDIDSQIRDAARQKRQATDDLNAAVEKQAGQAIDLADTMRTVAANAAEAAAEAVEIASMLPGKGAGPSQRVSPDQIVALAERVMGNGTMRQVLEMMGRLTLSMGTTRRQLRKGGSDEIVDIETGDDMRLVLPQEKVLLMHPMGRLDFFRRYAERALMQYDIWSEQDQKRGPIIFCTDGSDSMRGAPNIFARGLTLAACAIGNREGRNTAAIEFGSEGQLRTFFFPKGAPLDPTTALDFASHFFAGGTHINGALARAMKLITDESPFHSADVVIVTDGYDEVTPATIEIRDAMREAGVKIHGIAIGQAPTAYLLEVCDKTSSVFDYAGTNNASDRLAIDIS